MLWTKSRGRNSLSQRLLRASLITTALALLIANLAFSLVQYERSRKAALAEAGALADILSQNLAAAILFDNPAAASEVIGALERKPNVRRAHIHDGEGALFAFYTAPGSNLDHSETEKTRPPLSLYANNLRIERPILVDSEPVGSLEIFLQIESFGSWLLSTLRIILPIFLFSIVVAALLSHRLVGETMKPFESLIERLRHVGSASNAAALKIEAGTARELEPLYDRFHELTGEIENQRRLLAESEARYRVIVETQSEAICRLDRHFRLQFANPAFQEMVGIKLTHLIGTHPAKLMPPEDCDIINQALSTLSPKDHCKEISCRILGVGGELRWVQGTLRAFFDSRGRPSEYLLVGRDISDKRIAEEIAIQTSKLVILGEISASIAHELKQPLAVIDLAVQNSLDLLHDSNKSDAEARQYMREKMQRLSNNNTRIRTIIEHLQLFGRKVDERRYSFDARESMKAALMLIQYRLDEAGISIRYRSEENLPSLHGHPILFEQVLLNLLGNSIDAIESRRRNLGPPIQHFIAVSLKRSDFGLSCVVEDSGGGLPENLMKRATERYFTTKPPGKGTGLGLAISSDILTEMGGRLMLKQGEQGLCVMIDLPLDGADSNRPRSAVT